MSDIKSNISGRIKDDDLSDIERMLQKLDLLVGVDHKTATAAPPVIRPPEQPELAGDSPANSEEKELGRPLPEDDDFDQIKEPEYVSRPLKKVELLLKDSAQNVLSLDSLRKLSLKNAQLFKAAAIDIKILSKVQAIAVFPAENIARVSDLDRTSEDSSIERMNEQLLEPGPYVSLNSNDEYEAERYGYLSLIGDKLSIVPPLFVDKDKLHVYWGIFEEKAHKVTLSMITQWREILGIKSPLDVKKITHILQALEEGSHKRGAYLISEGKKPVHGIDSEVELLVQMERSDGIERSDGSIDLREVQYIPNVQEGQLVARRKPAVLGAPGIDVMGRIIPARKGQDVPLKPKDNVTLKKEEDAELYYASCAGGLKYNGKELSIVKILTLLEGVNYETGNIDFVGSVFIKGAVMEGFSVKAEDDITISEAVLEGAEVVSRNGNITIGGGVMGKRTRVIAHGLVRAQFIHDASIRAEDEIIIGNYSYNASLFTNGSITVKKGGGRRGGSISGGHAIALNGMDLWIAGSQSWIATELTAAFNPEIMVKRERIDAAIMQSSKHINRILNFFNMTSIDPKTIKSLIEQASGDKKKIFAQQAKLLGQTAKSYKALLEMRQALKKEEGDGKFGKATIKVRNTAYPEVTIRIGEHARKLNSERSAVIFKQGEKGIEEQY